MHMCAPRPNTFKKMFNLPEESVLDISQAKARNRMSKRLATAARPMSKSGRLGTTLQRPPTGNNFITLT